tara:strand:+ start:256 stop:549 length:294 start_codon:yes stop_codon:yes gene_type:complete
MKAERKNTFPVLPGSRTKSGRSMERRKKTYKEFRNERKTKRRRRNDGEYPSPNETKVSQETRTRIGGSTTHLLPEPRTGQVQGIERYDTPPAPENDY